MKRSFSIHVEKEKNNIEQMFLVEKSRFKIRGKSMRKIIEKWLIQFGEKYWKIILTNV